MFAVSGGESQGCVQQQPAACAGPAPSPVRRVAPRRQLPAADGQLAQQRRHRCRTGSSSSNAAAWSGAQGPHTAGGSMLDTAFGVAARVVDGAVGSLADVLQRVAPADAPRSKVETSVRGALALLLLALLKGVLSFVLVVGAAALAVYTATQVFGWTALSLGQGGGDVNYSAAAVAQQQQQQPGGPRYQQQYGQAGAHGDAAYGPAPGQAFTGGAPWQQQQQPQRQQQRQGGGRARPMQQGDVVDVYPFPRAGQ